MSDFRISYRAFEALFKRFEESVQRSAQIKGYRDTTQYQLGYMQSYFAMEFALLNEDAQVKLYDNMLERIVLLRKEISKKDLELTDKEVKFG